MSALTSRSPARPSVRLSTPVKEIIPPSLPEPFLRSDFIAAAIVTFVTFALYVLTLAPSVTMGDSGELITGAATFGVPHAPGYPLWTISGFLFSHLIPFGNIAWRVNLQSATFGALASGVMALLVAHSGRWLLQRWTDYSEQEKVRPYAFYAALFAGLSIGFSDVMWSQAVIAEVYTLNALFVMLVLLTFYFWMMKPESTDRLLIAVFIFALGLTNHHTLIQILPALIVAAALLLRGQFWSVLVAISLFTLTVLIYFSWLSNDQLLRKITEVVATGILVFTLLISFIFTERFSLRLALTGAALAVSLFLYAHMMLTESIAPFELFTWQNAPHWWLIGSHVYAGWLQLKDTTGFFFLILTILALGALYTSTLNRRMVIGVFLAGWVGLAPYGYESIASSTNPPMNWSFASLPSGFYYSIAREQFPGNLPNMIKGTIGKAVGLVPMNEVTDQMMGRSDYPRLVRLDITYYFIDLFNYLSPPLFFLPLALLIYCWRNDYPQLCWLGFLGVAFFTLAFLLQLITPPQSFDQLSIENFKVFHLPSHCLFVMFMGYGALAGLVFLRQSLIDETFVFAPYILGVPLLFLTLLPLLSNFEDCNQAQHWFGYQYGYDIMKPLDKNAIYIGGSDAGRFIPTYMAFVESQSAPAGKVHPDFDRRDVIVITQAALCDPFYTDYIRYQYDAAYRPKPEQLSWFDRALGRDKAYPTSMTFYSDAERQAAWTHLYDRHHGEHTLMSTEQVFEVNGELAQILFERNKASHTFYIEQSIVMPWMYPYLKPSGLILSLNPEPMTGLDPHLVAQDLKFWDDYSARLLSDPKFLADTDAQHYFSSLAHWHADLYHYRNLPEAEEHMGKIAVQLGPFMQDAVLNLATFYQAHHRYDEAIQTLTQACVVDPRNDNFIYTKERLENVRDDLKKLDRVQAELKKAPLDVGLNLQLARAQEEADDIPGMEETLRRTAGLTNWTAQTMSPIMQYYQAAHRPEAAVAFLEARAKIDTNNAPLEYALMAEQIELGQLADALETCKKVFALGGEDALQSMKTDPRFAPLIETYQFQDLLNHTKLAPATKPLIKPAAAPKK